MTERDTKFYASAKQVWGKLLHVKGGYIDVDEYDDGEIIEEYCTILANYAYDIAKHALEHDKIELCDMESEEVIHDHIPDLTRKDEV